MHEVHCNLKWQSFSAWAFMKREPSPSPFQENGISNEWTSLAFGAVPRQTIYCLSSYAIQVGQCAPVCRFFRFLNLFSGTELNKTNLTISSSSSFRQWSWLDFSQNPFTDKCHLAVLRRRNYKKENNWKHSQSISSKSFIMDATNSFIELLC